MSLIDQLKNFKLLELFNNNSNETKDEIVSTLVEKSEMDLDGYICVYFNKDVINTSENITIGFKGVDMFAMRDMMLSENYLYIMKAKYHKKLTKMVCLFFDFAKQNGSEKWFHLHNSNPTILINTILSINDLIELNNKYEIISPTKIQSILNNMEKTTVREIMEQQSRGTTGSFPRKDVLVIFNACRKYFNSDRLHKITSIDDKTYVNGIIYKWRSNVSFTLHFNVKMYLFQILTEYMRCDK